MTRTQRPTDKLVRDAAWDAKVRSRTDDAKLLDVLRPLFGELPPKEDLLHGLDLVEVRGGDVVFRQGDDSDGLFVVAAGRLRVEGDGLGGPHERRRGDVVGELGALRHQPRAGTVVALRDSLLIHVAQAPLDLWLSRYPTLLRALAVHLADRVAGGPSPEPCLPRFVTVVPHRDPEPLRRLCESLREVLPDEVEAIVLTSDDLARRRGVSRPIDEEDRRPRHGLWEGEAPELEAPCDIVVLVADPTPTPWTRRCLRQADTIVLVADAAEDPRPGRLEAHIEAVRAGRSVQLTLIHPPQTERPSQTLRWLAPGRFDRHHHVRRGDRRHLHSLARRLTGRAIGLVLSGGGARGFAHIGVWRALQEGRVDVDHVGGASVGALAASSFANGLSWQEARSVARECGQPRRLYDLTLPLASLMRSAKVTRQLERVWGDLCIEDLWTPFFAVAADLVHAERIVLRQGRVRDALRASIAIPGVFTPVVRDDRVLVDGAVIDNFPVDVMRQESGSDRVLGVNVAPRVFRPRVYDRVDHVSGWWVLAQRLNPFVRSPRVPSIGATLLRALEIHTERAVLEQRSRAHLLLEVNVEAVGLLEFHKVDQALDLGYAAAHERVRAWAYENAPTLLTQDASRRVPA